MTTQLRVKMETALKAIREIHSDTSGTFSDNLEAIQNIAAEVELIEDALEDDIKNSAE